MTDLAKLLGPYVRRIGNMISRGVVSGVNSQGKLQRLQLRLLAGEVKDNAEHFEPFGFTSKPLAGAEHVTVFLDGDRSHGITIVVADRRYRVQGLEDGESAMHDAFGNSAIFKKDGTFAVKVSTKVAIDSPLVTMTGDLQVTGNINCAKTITAPNVVGTTDVTGGGKSVKSHNHPNGTPNTGSPN